MRKRRPILVLEVEPAVRSSLSALPLAEALRKETGELVSLHAQACAFAAEGRIVKASRRMLEYLTKVAAIAQGPELKKQASEALTIIESSAAAALKSKKHVQAGKLIRIVKKAIEAGLVTAQKRWHRIRLLQL